MKMSYMSELDIERQNFEAGKIAEKDISKELRIMLKIVEAKK